ncbi:MAG TPA: carbohydrate kinase family protein [Planctomycetota bacterium]|nr:carbohydrate kinase family protein [Planctomycetota bacterium]
MQQKTDRSGIVVSGLACLDLVLFCRGHLKHREDLALVDKSEYRAGGPTSHVSKTIHSLGVDASVMTAIGDDANGETLLRLWRDSGFDTRHVCRLPNTDTSLSTLPVYPDGKRAIYFCLGANGVVTSEDIFTEANLGVLKSKKVVHFGYPPLMPCIQGQNLANCMKTVRRTGATVSLDTTCCNNEEEHRQMLRPAFPYIDIFVPNLDEAATVTGRLCELMRRVDQLSRHTGGMVIIEDVVEPEEILAIGDELLGEGIAIVAITLGPNGAYVCTGSAERIGQLCIAPADPKLWANKRMYYPTFAEVGRANATGAGDAFAGGFLAALCESDMGIESAVEFANAVGTYHVDMGRGVAPMAEILKALPALERKSHNNKNLMKLMK